ncbi:DUF2804 domain-containing protein [Microterricola pindariensis]|uniref:Glycosyl hydrolase family 2 n=1 Tax=Microterricola pindariensis TaxID=478010 RepID=A0ABX5AZA1_9MICO|nr:DUF2804 domain-containing protein [Microterricola pindariensis]PPL19778.1 glycosyl hydrolase family 2 [Microterricola pindariensis]
MTRTQTTTEREITAPVPLCLPNGRLNPAAVGWVRHPLIDTDRIGRGGYGWGRNKRWEYWAVTSPTHIVSITVSSLDYASLHQLWVRDRATGEEIDLVAISPLSGSATLPGTLGAGPARARTKALTVDIDEMDAGEMDAGELDSGELDSGSGAAAAGAGGTRLRAASARVSVDIVAERPAGQEGMGVVVPWGERLFQYTVKDVARPARGSVTIDGVRHELAAGDSWATLDHGRGRWPYSMTWNWGAASGIVDGKRIGLQLGGKWTAGTGSTENSLAVDGRLTKYGDELVWEYSTSDFLAPWRIRGEHLDLVFTPEFDRSSQTNMLVIGSETHQCFGSYSGTATDETGAVLRVDGVYGWAEHVHNRW